MLTTAANKNVSKCHKLITLHDALCIDGTCTYKALTHGIHNLELNLLILLVSKKVEKIIDIPLNMKHWSESKKKQEANISKKNTH
jgi:hypothetical protein